MINIKIQTRQPGDYVVSVEGRLDSDTYMQLDEKLKPLLIPMTRVLILDFKDLDYISSSGLGVVFKAKKIMEANKGSFAITHLEPQIRKVFEIVKALPHKSIFESIEEVDAYLDIMQKKEMEKQDPSKDSHKEEI